MGGHQRTVGISQTYITPRWILQPLGRFDLDPCAAKVRPWACATENITEQQNGLGFKWSKSKRVWLNPPFDTRQVVPWIEALAEHGNGTLLIHARTETEWFDIIWQRATAILFLRKRVNFYLPDGTLARGKGKKGKPGRPATSGAPVVLVAFGDRDAKILANSGLPGTFCRGWTRTQWPHETDKAA